VTLLAGLLPALLQGVLGGIGAGNEAPEAPLDAGVQSAMGSSMPAPMQMNPTGGSTFSDLVRLGISKGVSSLVGARMNAWQAKNAGHDSRAYLDAQFPELNPWEKAGVGASDAGVGLAGQDNQSAMQDKELKTRIGMQEQQIGFGQSQIAAQERMNAVSSAAGVASAAIGAGPAWGALPSLETLREAQTETERARAGREEAEASSTTDANKRAWASNLVNAILSPYSSNAAVGGADSTFRKDAVTALGAQAAANGVGSLVSGGAAGKLWKWVSGLKRPVGTAPARVEPAMSGSVVE